MSSRSGSRSSIDQAAPGVGAAVPDRLRRAAALAAGLAGWMALSSPAAATCSGLSFGSLPSSVNWRGSGGTGYAVFDAADHVQSVAFTVVRRSGTCNFFVTASLPGGTDTFTSRQLGTGASALRFNLYTTTTHTNILRDVPSAGPNDVISGSFGNGGSNTVILTYYFDIAPLQVVLPGSYRTIMQFKLFQGNLVSNTLAQSLNVVHQSSVLPVTEVSVASAGQRFDPQRRAASFELGVLNSGVRGALRQANGNLQVRTNTGYLVTLQSQNSGALRIGPEDANAIKYALIVNGAVVDLTGGRPVPVASGSGVTSAAGIAHSLVVSVDLSQPNLARASAGSYSDVITVSVTGR